METQENKPFAAPASQHDDGWPGEIYLQAGDEPLGNFSEYDEVSWCDHPEGESDVRYVRAETTESDIGELVNRFLGWPLPAGLLPNIDRPIGTHFLNADQARAMFEYVLASRCRAQGGDTSNKVSNSPAPVTAEPADLSASNLLKLWGRANAAATDTMPAPFVFAKLLLANTPAPADRDAIREAYELAAKACEGERVEETGTDGDKGYNTAVEHCAAAIRALKSMERAADAKGGQQ